MNQTAMAEAPYHETPVLKFHETFNHPVAYFPQVPSTELRKLRVALLLEEVIELAEASGMNVRVDRATDAPGKPMKHTFEVWPSRENRCNMVEVADALADIRYVTDGANLVYGIPGHAILRIVHQSNMSKLGPDGKPIFREDGKVLKGPDYWEPQDRIRQLLVECGMQPNDGRWDGGAN